MALLMEIKNHKEVNCNKAFDSESIVQVCDLFESELAINFSLKRHNTDFLFDQTECSDGKGIVCLLILFVKCHWHGHSHSHVDKQFFKKLRHEYVGNTLDKFYIIIHFLAIHSQHFLPHSLWLRLPFLA